MKITEFHGSQRINVVRERNVEKRRQRREDQSPRVSCDKHEKELELRACVLDSVLVR